MTVATPRWVPCLIIALALLQPIAHVLIAYAPPQGTVPTGLHIPDSALFIESMELYEQGFTSPYATCSEAEQDARYYSVPHLWLYAALGMLVRVLGLNAFLCYGFASGLGAAFYLAMVWRLLRTMVPAHAPRAFLLFALAGGPMGLLYLIALRVGAFDNADFAAIFLRWAYYDLTEGPHLNPTHIFPRLYYTFSLGCCLGGMTTILQGGTALKPGRLFVWGILIVAGSFVNARFTVFTFGLMLAWLALNHDLGTRNRIKLCAAYFLPMLVGFLPAFMLMRNNPAVVQNHVDHGNMAMWIAPFLVVALPMLLLAVKPIIGVVRASAGPPRWLLLSAMGYLSVFLVLYVIRQTWYGAIFSARDGSVAAAISDPALLGVLPALVVGRRISQGGARDDCTLRWITLWFLGFLALSISGFGQGCFLRFGPQRLEVFLWLPLATLAARSLSSWRPMPRRVVVASLCGLGTISITVATFLVQGPVLREAARGPWPDLHPEIMSATDATLMDSIGAGRVAAPAPASDVIVRRRGKSVLFGIGTFNLTTRGYTELSTLNAKIFDPDTSPENRAVILEAECIDWIYCPDTWPTNPATINALYNDRALELVVREGRGAVFRVR